MNKEEMIRQLLSEGYTQEEAEEKVNEYEEEEEHLPFFRFMELHEHQR